MKKFGCISLLVLFVSSVFLVLWAVTIRAEFNSLESEKEACKNDFLTISNKLKLTLISLKKTNIEIYKEKEIFIKEFFDNRNRFDKNIQLEELLLFKKMLSKHKRLWEYKENDVLLGSLEANLKNKFIEKEVLKVLEYAHKYQNKLDEIDKFLNTFPHRQILKISSIL